MLVNGENFEYPKDPGYYFPAEILHHPLLTYKDQILFSLLDYFSKIFGECQATNKILAKINRVSPPTISKSLKQLEKYKFIEINSTQRPRQIFINPNYPQYYYPMLVEVDKQFKESFGIGLQRSYQ